MGCASSLYQANEATTKSTLMIGLADIVGDYAFALAQPHGQPKLHASSNGYVMRPRVATMSRGSGRRRRHPKIGEYSHDVL
jgi:hypothetical protein